MVDFLDGRDRKVVFQRSITNSVDAAGSPVVTWTTLSTQWAKVVPLSGAESLRLGRQMATEISRFFVLYDSNIRVTDRISYQSRYWDIQNIKELGRGEALEIVAEAIE